MPDTKSKEVLVVFIVCMILFVILAVIISLFVLLYQRRRKLQQEHVKDLQRQFLEQSLKAQIEIQEQTFRAISQEIHDNVGQILSLAKVQINIMNQQDTMDKGLLLDVKENIGKAMSDLRDLAKGLDSEWIGRFSITELLELETERINKLGIIRAELFIEGQQRELVSQKKLILFRIIQEGIQNCIKHAEAANISISFHYTADCIRIAIKDDGKGFDPAAALDKGFGSGLANIRSRADLTGGTSLIESILNKGSCIHLTIPYE